MAVLGWISVAGVAFVTGCYSPELRDCAVSCGTAADCAPDQICGSDGMCAAPEIAGHCSGIVASSDAGVDAPITADAPILVDAALPIDAAPQRLLRIEINGRGGVTAAGIGTCHHTSSTHPCTFVLMPGVPTTLQAIPDAGNRFDKWEAGACNGQDATCTIVSMQLLTEVKAKFRQGEEDD